MQPILNVVAIFVSIVRGAGFVKLPGEHGEDLLA